MANSYHHAFNAQFSFVLLLTILVVAVVAFLIGYWSVRIAPRKSVKKCSAAPAGAPKYMKSKARAMARNYRKTEYEYDNCSIIMFRSNLFDGIVAVISATICLYVLITEHFDGITQFFINSLGSRDAAVWGDILALMAVAAGGSVFAAIFFGLCRLGQFKKADDFATRFVAESVRPVFGEHRSAIWYAQMIVFIIKDEISAKMAERKEKETVRS